MYGRLGVIARHDNRPARSKVDHEPELNPVSAHAVVWEGSGPTIGEEDTQ
jgi:hypothetical protein